MAGPDLQIKGKGGGGGGGEIDIHYSSGQIRQLKFVVT